MANLIENGTINIRGINYTFTSAQGQKFKGIGGYEGNGNADGTYGPAQELNPDEDYWMCGYAVNADGSLASYPYLVFQSNNTARGYYREEVFPYGYYTVTYDANGGSGAPESQTKTAGTDITLRTETPTREGYVFKGWRAVLDPDDESRVDYQPGGTYSTDSNVTMFAIWELITYNVKYYPSCSDTIENMPGDAVKEYGKELTLSNNVPTRENYEFLGWATSESNSQKGIVSYSPSDTYSENAELKLYAVWKAIYVEPKIIDLKVVRCDENEIESSVGTYAKVSFSWTTDSKLTLASGKIDYYEWGQKKTLTLDKVDSYSGNVVKVLQGGAYRLQDNSFTVTIEDSFGATTSESFNLPAIVYKHPEITELKAIRTDSFGNEDENGTCCKVTFGWSVDKLDGSNSVSNILVNYREYDSGFDYSETIDVEYDSSLTEGTATAFSPDIVFKLSKSYEFKIVVIDKVTESEKYTMITYGFETMNFLKGGHGIAIGKKSTEEDLFDVAMDTRFRGNVTFDAETNMDYQGISANKAVINDSLTVAGRKYGENQILWEGYSQMDWSDGPITLSDYVSNQPNGIVLIFSGYDPSTGTVKDRSINTFFVSKKDIELFPWTKKDGDGGHTFLLNLNAGFSNLAAKYLYFTDNKIYGHEGNVMADADSGILYDNRNYVLRYVIGV